MSTMQGSTTALRLVWRWLDDYRVGTLVCSSQRPGVAPNRYSFFSSVDLEQMMSSCTDVVGLRPPGTWAFVRHQWKSDNFSSYGHPLPNDMCSQKPEAAPTCSFFSSVRLSERSCCFFETLYNYLWQNHQEKKQFLNEKSENSNLFV